MLYAMIAAAAAVLLYVILRKKPGRICACGRPKIDKGSHFACVVCDFDPDPRP